MTGHSLSSLRHTHLTEYMRGEKEREVALAIREVDTENADLKLRRKEIRARSAKIESDDEEAEYDIVSSQVQREKKALELSQSLLKALLAKIQEPSISQIATKMQVQQDQSIHVSFENSKNIGGLQMGVNNAAITFNAGRN